MNNKIDSVTVGDINTNCWLYSLEDEVSGTAKNRPCAVIDPGDEADLIITRLNELGWVPRYIFLTHGHIDHIAALPDLLEYFGKNNSGALPKTGIHREDAQYLGKNSLSLHRESFSAAGGDPAFVDALWKALPDGDMLFEDGEEIGPFRILHLPGHSPGSSGFYDEKAGILFSGDTLFRGTWGRTDLPGGNERQIKQSLKRLLSMNGDIVVCPGHGPLTAIKEEIGLLSEI
jgi:glyoxylase-like metal-dependent hydrolase (beta-lactamase superfamily II)